MLKTTGFFPARLLAVLVAIAYLTGCGTNCALPAFNSALPGTQSCTQNADGVPLGPTLVTFAVLGGSTVTNTDSPTIVTGELGVSPGLAITGFPPGQVIGGSIHRGDPTAATAQGELVTAYNLAAGKSSTATKNGEIGGMTLGPGVYTASTIMGITGTVTLDGQNQTNPVFVFQVGSTLTTATDSVVKLINGANACNVTWQIGASATLGTRTSFKGNILALQAITLNTGAVVIGRALARNAAVTLDDNLVTKTGP
jgi:Ice-binding-like